MNKFIFFCLILFPFILFADTIILKSGRSISGKIIQKDDSKVLVVESNNGNNVTFYSMDEIESIEDSKRDDSSSNTIPLKTKLYGMLKTDFVYANNAVLSYGIESLQSANSVKRQVMARDRTARWGIMFNQSMIGYDVDYGEKIKGKVLFDFVDLTQSNAIISTKPRLLVGKIEYSPNKYFSVFGGQDFDIFSNLIPHSYNFSGLMNESGNMGFMRQQIGFKVNYSFLSLTLAAGRPQINYGVANPSLGNELNSTPLFSSNLKIAIDKINLYFSGTYVDLKVRQPLIDTNRDNLYLYYDVGVADSTNTFLPAYKIGGDGPTKVKSGGYSFGIEAPISKSFEFKGEVNYGQNMGDLGMSSSTHIQTTSIKENISNSNLGIISTNNILATQLKNNSQPIYNSIKELGGWGSIKYKMNERFELGLHGGATKILNPEDIVPASNSTLSKSQTDVSSGYWIINSKLGGVRENNTMGYRIAFLPESNLTFFFQHDYIQTFYKDSDREKGLLGYIDTVVWETGAVTLKNVNYSYLKSSGKATSNVIRFGMALAF